MNRVKNKIKELRDPTKPVHEVRIQIYADSRVEVMGFPSNYHVAMDLMTAGLRRVANYFMAMEAEGKLDEKKNIKQNSIITLDPKIALSRGKLN